MGRWKKLMQRKDLADEEEDEGEIVEQPDDEEVVPQPTKRVPTPPPVEKPRAPVPQAAPVAPIAPVVEEETEMVVTQLPQVAANRIRGDDGKIHRLITVEEALQELLENTREILKRTEG